MNTTLLAALATAASCAREVPTEIDRAKILPLLPGRALQTQVEIKPLEGCEAVDAAIRKRLVAEMWIALIEAEDFRKKYGSGGAIPTYSAEGGYGEDDDSSAAGSPEGGITPSSTTSTDGSSAQPGLENRQDASLAEPDLVKSDGRYLYTTAGGGTLKIVDLAQGTLVARYPLSKNPGRELLLDSEHHRLWILPDRYVNNDTNPEVVALDISNPADPRKVYSVALNLPYRGARLGGDKLSMIETGPASPPIPGLKLWLSKDDSAEEVGHANEALIQSADLDLANRLGTDCSRVHDPSVPAEIGLTEITQVDLASLEISRTRILARMWDLSATQGWLTLTYRHWLPYPSAPGDTDGTYLFVYDLEHDAYLGAGAVEGHPINTFSIDTWSTDSGVKHLRVATQISAAQGVRKTRVTTLAPDGAGSLVPLGQTEDLAPGEQLQSARFDGDRGYVVTYRVVDPLFALDLSDPTHPEILGELKVPGYSTYLHPLSGHRLIGVGYSGAGWRTKISVFDASDPAAPIELASTDLDPGEYTNTNWDHRAFIYSPELEILALPTTRWPDSRIRLLAIPSMSDLGSLSFSSLNTTSVTDYGTYAQPALVQRPLLIDDTVFGVSDHGILGSKIGNPAQITTEVRWKPIWSWE